MGCLSGAVERSVPSNGTDVSESDAHCEQTELANATRKTYPPPANRRTHARLRAGLYVDTEWYR